jgi:hypothetical protein
MSNKKRAATSPPPGKNIKHHFTPEQLKPIPQCPAGGLELYSTLTTVVRVSTRDALSDDDIIVNRVKQEIRESCKDQIIKDIVKDHLVNKYNAIKEQMVCHTERVKKMKADTPLTADERNLFSKYENQSIAELNKREAALRYGLARIEYWKVKKDLLESEERRRDELIREAFESLGDDEDHMLFSGMAIDSFGGAATIVGAATDIDDDETVVDE